MCKLFTRLSQSKTIDHRISCVTWKGEIRESLAKNGIKHTWRWVFSTKIASSMCGWYTLYVWNPKIRSWIQKCVLKIFLPSKYVLLDNHYLLLFWDAFQRVICTQMMLMTSGFPHSIWMNLHTFQWILFIVKYIRIFIVWNGSFKKRLNEKHGHIFVLRKTMGF